MDDIYRKLLWQKHIPPCEICGKEHGATEGGTAIGNHEVCSPKCFKRMEMRVNNGLAPYKKDEITDRDLLRIRIRQLEHQLKIAKSEAKSTKILECRDFNCEHYKNGKCALKRVRMIVDQNELVCEDADKPTNAGITYI